jgi:hypothetical protein
MCSKKLKAALPLWLTFYSDIDEAKRRLISKISESTIDRILKSYRSRPKGKGISMQLYGIRGRPLKDILTSWLLFITLVTLIAVPQELGLSSFFRPFMWLLTLFYFFLGGPSKP